MKFLLGMIMGVLLVPLGAFLYIRQGYAPVATSAPMLPLERQVTSMALRARIAKEAPVNSPMSPNEENLVAGVRIYRDECAVCHGMRDESRTMIAKGLFPHPPALLHGKGVTDDPPGHTWWIVRNGIRLTGMPGFAGSLTDDQIWQVSLMLANADKLPPGAAAALDGAISLAQ
uniref:Cytochrome c domain-containing protein n=1 Tax=Solibacter usitatus (strain Ellin6076) TaxID=234267 RepID=Q02BX0_SOLUE